MSYAVGQVLYVVRRKENMVFPVRVTEEVTRRTLSGLTVDYTVQAGAAGDSSVSLDTLLADGEVFETPDQVVDALSTRAKAYISKLVGSAVQKAKQWYGDAGDDSQQPAAGSEEQVQVVLPDGTLAKAKLPRAV